MLLTDAQLIEEATKRAYRVSTSQIGVGFTDEDGTINRGPYLDVAGLKMVLRAQLREVHRQMTSGEYGIDTFLGAPDGSVSFRWTLETWKKFEEECK